MGVTTIGLDLAKNVFQVLVGIEACGTAHHWAREIAGLGHTVKLMPPAYVKPYVKRAGEEIDRLETRILEWRRASDVSRRLATIPGIGPITASAAAAAVPDGTLFRSGRQFAAWLGLTPKAHSSGGKERQTGIGKQGDGYLRRLLVVGATAVMRPARQDNAARCWAAKLLERKPAKLAAVALANKTARIAWAVLTRGGTYAAPTAV
ncbi:MAG TPA: IS110 family transposase [Azospirillum sp.]|nr:IS110 family transposase [Azospirillum sp.]